MACKYPTKREAASLMVREDFYQPNLAGSTEFQPAIAEMLRTHEPLEAVRLITVAVEKQLAAQAKPKAQYAMAIMRGLLAREELKQAEGGSYSAEDTRLLLGISKAAVLKRYQKRQLVGWREASQAAVRFPAWQFRDGNVLSGLSEVLAIFAKEDWVDDWTRVVFFLNPRQSLSGKRPLDLLRDGETRLICQLAKAKLE